MAHTDDSNEFTCAQCGGTFTKAWDDSEAEAEANDLFGVEHSMSDPDFAVVCEECFQKMNIKDFSAQLEVARRVLKVMEELASESL